jgi:hypothetical protein
MDTLSPTPTPQPAKPKKRRLQALDRLALTLMVGLSFVMVGLIMLGDQAAARVRDFSWQGRAVGAEDLAFLMTFSRPMDHTSVEQNLQITPALPGKFSWAGRRMAYTLDVPVPYGETFKLQLAQAKDKFSQGEQRFTPFQEGFQTRDRAFAYLGLEGSNQGRLILYNLTRQAETILTPPELIVLDFKPYPRGEKILFSAADYKSYQKGEQNQKLYTVSTGLNPGNGNSSGDSSRWRWRFWQSQKASPAGVVTEILDSDAYQNLKFDLSPNGKNIVVQRLSRTQPSDFGPWLIREGQDPKPLETEPGGNFIIAPDSESLLLQQGEGTAVIDLGEATGIAQANSQKLDKTQRQVGATLDFLPQYGLVLDVASDGAAAAMVNFNQNDPAKRYIQSLVWVSNQGIEKPLLDATGSILDAQFDATNTLLYCLISQLLPGEAYQVQPYLIAVDVKSGQLYELLKMPPQPSVNMSLSPDGLAVLFDETVEAESGTSLLRSADGRAIASGQLWLMPLFKAQADRLAKTPAPVQPQALPFKGIRPIWLP